jgi:hypothetical protein
VALLELLSAFVAMRAQRLQLAEPELRRIVVVRLDVISNALLRLCLHASTIRIAVASAIDGAPGDATAICCAALSRRSCLKALVVHHLACWCCHLGGLASEFARWAVAGRPGDYPSPWSARKP